MKPGERLMEIHLANKLGVSRTPIREAIRKLELEGLVTMIPGAARRVLGLRPRSLRDVLKSARRWMRLPWSLPAKEFRRKRLAS